MCPAVFIWSLFGYPGYDFSWFSSVVRLLPIVDLITFIQATNLVVEFGEIWFVYQQHIFALFLSDVKFNSFTTT